MKIYSDLPPPKRTKTNRLTEEMKRISPGQSVIVCTKTAKCLTEFLRYNGTESRRLTLSPNVVKVWAV